MRGKVSKVVSINHNFRRERRVEAGANPVRLTLSALEALLIVQPLLPGSF